MTDIIGVKVHTLPPARDDRGYFLETFRASWLPNGANPMVQGNCSSSKTGVLRGLHYHLKQADLWFCPTGQVRVALFDFREGSPTYKKTMLFEIGVDSPASVYIPHGVAHGFLALRDSVLTYLVDNYYTGDDELGLAWDDPGIGIEWGIEKPILSKRDLLNNRLEKVFPELRPRYGV